ncbi:MAG: hypothetical protein HXS54_13115 [Theionarchaea archaeon]|nr:hypothetical protein [Theionarchaea archaeon]
MGSFSQRKGLKRVRDTVQRDSMDDDLRTGLWNALDIHYWQKMPLSHSHIIREGPSWSFLLRLYDSFFKWRIDTIKDYWPNTCGRIREYFFNSKWFEVYDFIEFAANNYQNDSVNSEFMDYCNLIMERELSAYRFIGKRIVEITSEMEIAEIEDALTPLDSLSPVTSHLQSALNLISDRQSPDYRNSIKESISAVEAMCKLITGSTRATLGDCLKKIDEKIELHPALKEAFSKLYGYTSSSDGIRHAMIEKANLSFEDAKFMLVSCSAFINYLKVKESKAKMKL